MLPPASNKKQPEQLYTTSVRITIEFVKQNTCGKSLCSKSEAFSFSLVRT